MSAFFFLLRIFIFITADIVYDGASHKRIVCTHFPVSKSCLSYCSKSSKNYVQMQVLIQGNVFTLCIAIQCLLISSRRFWWDHNSVTPFGSSSSVLSTCPRTLSGILLLLGVAISAETGGETRHFGRTRRRNRIWDHADTKYGRGRENVLCSTEFHILFTQRPVRVTDQSKTDLEDLIFLVILEKLDRIS
jgi:hypothetical protein